MKKLLTCCCLIIAYFVVDAQKISNPYTRYLPLVLQNREGVVVTNETTFGATISKSSQANIGSVIIPINISTDDVPILELSMDMPPRYNQLRGEWTYRYNLIGIDDKEYWISFTIQCLKGVTGDSLCLREKGYTPKSGAFEKGWQISNIPDQANVSLDCRNNSLKFSEWYGGRLCNVSGVLGVDYIKGIKSVDIILTDDREIRLQSLHVKVPMEYANASLKKWERKRGEYSASGSGFVISRDGIIATNYHVVAEANGIDILVNRNGEIKTYKAQVLVSDKTNDISLIKIDDPAFTSFPAIPYAVKTPLLDVGTSVFALGYPMSNILGEEIKVTDGIISSKTGYQGDIVTYQISVPIQPGNSGGPLFDKSGNLVGITNAGVPDAQNVGYAIKTSYLKNLVDVAPTTFTLPATNSIVGLSFTEKIKRLTSYVVLIKVY